MTVITKISVKTRQYLLALSRVIANVLVLGERNSHPPHDALLARLMTWDAWPAGTPVEGAPYKNTPTGFRR